jgi:uncharacterized protein YndB with AHSA1/START domain
MMRRCTTILRQVGKLLRASAVALFVVALHPAANGLETTRLSKDPPAKRAPMSAKAARITWNFAAPAEKVWQAWTDPKLVSRWFGSDPNGKVLSAKLDVRPGKTFEVMFQDSDGTQHTASGVYQALEPHRLLRFTWGWKSEPGIETSITVSLTSNGASTRMDFEHAGIDYASTHDYESGWRGTFVKMEKAIANES